MGDAIGYELVKELAVRRQGRSPVLTPQGWVYSSASLNGAPVETTDGVDVTGAVVALVAVRLRSDPAKQKAWLRLDTLQVATYGLVVGGVEVGGVVNGASLEATATAQKDNLNASPTFATNLGGVASIDANHPTVVQYEIDITKEGLKTFTQGGTYATTAASSVAEATEVIWRLWGLPVDRDVWHALGEVPVQHTRFDAAASLLVACGPYRRLYIEVLGTDGAVLLSVGPCGVDGFTEDQVTGANTAYIAAEDDVYDFETTEKGTTGLGTRLNEVESGSARRITRQAMVSVATSSTELLAANPRRKGFFLRNTDSAGTIYTVWAAGSVSAAATTHLPVNAGGIRTQQGPDTPGDQLLAIADVSGPYDVWVEEWE